MTINLTTGQNTTLTATMVDSFSVPVPGVNTALINWTVDNNLIASLSPTFTNPNLPPPSLPVTLEGSTIPVTAVAPGQANITITYDDGVVTLTQVIVVLVTPPAVAAFLITQGPVG